MRLTLLLLAWALAGFTLGCVVAYPAILEGGRLWAEEGQEFLAYALRQGPALAFLYVHKRHLDLIPNLAASMAALVGGRSALRIFPTVSLLGYLAFLSGFSRQAAAAVRAGALAGARSPTRAARLAISLSCALTGALTVVHPRAWESVLNTINSWSLVVPALVLHALAPEGSPRGRSPLAFIAGMVCFPVLLLLPGFALLAVAPPPFRATAEGQHLIHSARAVCVGLFAALAVQGVVILLAPSELQLGNERSFGQQVLPLLPLLTLWRGLLPLLLPLPQALPQLLWPIHSLPAAGVALLATGVILALLLGPWLLPRIPIRLPLWLPAAVTVVIAWQLAALLLSVGGSASYVGGGGFRYFVPLFLLTLAGVACLAIQDLAATAWRSRPLVPALVLVWLLLQAGVSLEAHRRLHLESQDWWCFRVAPAPPYETQIATPAGPLPLCPLGWP